MFKLFLPSIIEWCVRNRDDFVSSNYTEDIVIQMLPDYLMQNDVKCVDVSYDDIMYANDQPVDDIKGVPIDYIMCEGTYFEMLPGIWRYVPVDRESWVDYLDHANLHIDDWVHIMYIDPFRLFNEFCTVYNGKLYAVVRKHILQQAYLNSSAKMPTTDDLLRELHTVLNENKYIIKKVNVSQEDLYNGTYKVSKCYCTEAGLYINLGIAGWRLVPTTAEELNRYYQHVKESELDDVTLPLESPAVFHSFFQEVYGNDLLTTCMLTAMNTKGVGYESSDVINALINIVSQEVKIEISIEDIDDNSFDNVWNEDVSYVNGVPVWDICGPGEYFEAMPGVWRRVVKNAADLAFYKTYLN